jgi:hypothetical protein
MFCGGGAGTEYIPVVLNCVCVIYIRINVHNWRDCNVLYTRYIQGDQKVSVHLMITKQKVTSNVQSVPRQSPNIYWHAELCSRIPCSVQRGPYSECILRWPSSTHRLCGDCIVLYCNRRVHRDFLITRYIYSLIHSFSTLSYDRSKASSNASSPHSAT